PCTLSLPVVPYTTLFRSVERFAAGVHLQNLLSARQIGCFHADLTIEASRTQQCGVQHIGPVCCRDQDDAAAHIEAVHFYQQRVRSEEHTSELQSRFDLVC